MFFWAGKFKEVMRTFKFRDEWGQMRDVEVDMMRKPRLSDSELADRLETNITTVITHRRD